MKTCKKSFISACVACVIAMLLPSLNVYAADTYTVTFRPGNVGYFATEANEGGDKQAMAEVVASQEYGGYSYSVTKNGAIKVTVPSGMAAPTAPTYIQAQSGYFVKNSASWGPTGEAVDRNTDYVVDYGKLVDGVEYTVKYVDSVSGESIAPVYIAQANIGESRSVTAPAQIVISGGAVYNLTSAGTLELVLDADSSKNVFTFSYTLAPSGTTVDEVVIGADGQIITTTDYVTTTTGGTQTVVAAGGAGAGEGGGEQGAVAEDGGADVVAIEEEGTPLADNDGNGDDTTDTLNISEGDVPLANREDSLANMAMLGASIFAFGAMFAAGMWLYIKKKHSEENGENTTVS